ncbi:hypothetical protein HG530_003874 [Fusarium avenaceum]|nr:hypothetical protein HG530_003874 [Fusarium avenaceum]
MVKEKVLGRRQRAVDPAATENARPNVANTNATHPSTFETTGLSISFYTSRTFLIRHPRLTLGTLVPIIDKLSIPTRPPQHTKLYKDRPEGKGSGEWESNWISWCIGNSESAKRNGGVADINNHDCKRNDNCSCFRLFSHEFGKPRHERWTSGIGSICHEVEAHNDLVIRWPCAENCQHDAEEEGTARTDLPSPVLPVRKAVEDQIGADLQSVATQWYNVDLASMAKASRKKDDEEAHNSLGNGDNTRDDKKPLPAGYSVGAVEIAIESCLQGTEEHGSGDVGDVEAGDSEGEFFGGVPVED